MKILFFLLKNVALTKPRCPTYILNLQSESVMSLHTQATGLRSPRMPCMFNSWCFTAQQWAKCIYPLPLPFSHQRDCKQTLNIKSSGNESIT